MASTSTFASTSSLQWNYDVFLSFKGEDTRFNCTDHLYTNFIGRGIHTFRDDSLKRGKEIAPKLLKVIEESRFALILFSENYASSRWCLDELVKIMECNTGRFGEAFSNYEEDTRDEREGARLEDCVDRSSQFIRRACQGWVKLH